MVHLLRAPPSGAQRHGRSSDTYCPGEFTDDTGRWICSSLALLRLPLTAFANLVAAHERTKSLAYIRLTLIYLQSSGILLHIITGPLCIVLGSLYIMLMLPSPTNTIHSRYSSAFAPGVRFALELTDSIPDMDSQGDLQRSRSQNMETPDERQSSLGIYRYVYPTSRLFLLEIIQRRQLLTPHLQTLKLGRHVSRFSSRLFCLANVVFRSPRASSLSHASRIAYSKSWCPSISTLGALQAIGLRSFISVFRE